MRIPAPSRPAFTLVELVTAASLMTVMMIGVVQVFGIITQTAAEAEGLSFAQQQARVLFDRLHQDLHGMTREGYLTITHKAIQRDATNPDRYTLYNSSMPPTAPLTGSVNPETVYFCDTLAFVTIGQFSAAWKTSEVSGLKKGEPGCAAEVVYTNNVQTPNLLLRATTADPASSSSAMNPRKGLLARSQWIWYLDGAGTSQGEKMPGDSGTLAGKSLAEMFASQRGGRVPDAVGGGSNLAYVQVWPWRPSDTAAPDAQYLPSLRQVIASCVSEFYVEVVRLTDQTGTPVDDYGPRPDLVNPENAPRVLPGPRAVSNPDPTAWNVGPATSASIGSRTYRWNEESWPRGLRVTVAIHDPADTKPIQVGKRAEGYAFQETFWLGDP